MNVGIPDLSDRRMVRTRIEGLCPRCRTWFEADDWFDDTTPVPSCPSCNLVPWKLAYVHAQGRRVEHVLTVELAASEQWLG